MSVPRKLLVAISVILTLHFIGIGLLGHSLAGSILGNSLQVVASGLAAAYSFSAHRRAQGASRHFWVLVAAGFLSWTVANLGWMYYEDWLRVPVPSPSWVHFLYDVPGGFFAMSLFLDEERDSARPDAQTLLDFLQIAILICFLYFDLYYIPARAMSFHAALVRDTIIADTENFVLVLLAVLRIRWARPIQLRSLYWGLTLYLGFFALAAGIADYGQIYKRVATGSWYDLGWTLPFLLAAVMASGWQAPLPLDAAAHRSATLPDLAATNLALAFAPLFVVVQSVRLPPEWRWVGIVTVPCLEAAMPRAWSSPSSAKSGWPKPIAIA